MLTTLTETNSVADNTITPRQRVDLMIAHKSADRIARDFAAEPAVWQKMMVHFNVNSKEELLQILDTDCRVISYDFEAFCNPPGDIKPESASEFSAWKRTRPDGIKNDVWGACRKRIKNEFADYEDLCQWPLANASSIEDLKNHNWPLPDWWDFSRLEEITERVNPNHKYHLRWRMGSIFETSWSLVGFDKFFMDLALAQELPCYIMDRITEIHIENLKRVLELAGDKIDMVYLYDDIASQQNLLMSVDLWKKTIAPRQKKLFSIAKANGKSVMYHCCGNMVPLIDELIEIGVDVLNPLQPLAVNIDYETLKKRFGNKITFHGGIDIQELLPHGTAEQVSEEVERAKRILGENGGYILSPAHHIQADTPIENILALYGLN